MKKIIIYIFSAGITLLLLNCNKGIAPLPVEPLEDRAGFSGTITFEGEWPDSVQRTHLVVFENLLLSPGDFSILNLKYISAEIPFGINTYEYSSLDSSFAQIGAGAYRYVAVVQSATPELSLNRPDWFVAGVYYANNDTSAPGTLVIPEKALVRNINIHCDFNNLPPQPPGGN